MKLPTKLVTWPTNSLTVEPWFVRAIHKQQKQVLGQFPGRESEDFMLARLGLHVSHSPYS